MIQCYILVYDPDVNICMDLFTEHISCTHIIKKTSNWDKNMKRTHQNGQS